MYSKISALFKNSFVILTGEIGVLNDVSKGTSVYNDVIKLTSFIIFWFHFRQNVVRVKGWKPELSDLLTSFYGRTAERMFKE